MGFCLILAELLINLPLKHVGLDTLKYLDVFLVAATKWKLSLAHLKLRFYRAFKKPHLYQID